MPLACHDFLPYRIVGTGVEALLVERAEEPLKDWLWFPGGRILRLPDDHERCQEFGLEDSMLQLLLRETGLHLEDIRSIRPLGGDWTRFRRNMTYFDREGNKVQDVELRGEIHTQNMVFAVEVANTWAPKVTKDVTEYRWVSEDVPVQSLRQDVCDYVLKFLSALFASKLQK